MKFWDSSAIAPLLVGEPESPTREAQVAADPRLLVWHGTEAELESAICRREREGLLDAAGAAHARSRLKLLAGAWLEVQATAAVKARAIRLLRVHPLRAAAAFQLAAALVAFREAPTGNGFLTADTRLARAAALEGFEAG